MSPGTEISVIVPVRDGERYLGEAIDSILAQTLAPAEVIVVDDGSRDDTAAVVGAYPEPVSLVRQEPAGVSAAVNTGLSLARCDLIAFLDADDVWEPTKLELQAAALEQDHGLDLVFCQMTQFLSPDLSELERARIRFPSGSAPAHMKAAMLARRAAIDRVGAFDERWQITDFVDWLARARDLGLNTRVLPEVLVRRRLHADNSTRRRGHQEYASVLSEILRRRREAPGSGR